MALAVSVRSFTRTLLWTETGTANGKVEKIEASLTGAPVLVDRGNSPVVTIGAATLTVSTSPSNTKQYDLEILGDRGEFIDMVPDTLYVNLRQAIVQAASTLLNAA